MDSEEDIELLRSDPNDKDEFTFDKPKRRNVDHDSNGATCSSTPPANENNVNNNDNCSSSSINIQPLLTSGGASTSKEIIFVEQRNAAAGGASNGAANSSSKEKLLVEVVDLTDDEDKDNETQNATGGNVSPIAEEDLLRYGLSRKHKINADAGKENGQDICNIEEKEAFDIFSLSAETILKLTKKPELIGHTCCKIHFPEPDGTDKAKIQVVTGLLEKCGPQFKAISIYFTKDDEENFSFLQHVFESTTALEEVNYTYHSRDDALNILELLKILRREDCLPRLHSLKLVGSSGEEKLTAKHLTLLTEIKTNFRSLELGHADAIWEDTLPMSSTLEIILEQQKTSLESLIIHGGFRGLTDKETIIDCTPRKSKLNVKSKIIVVPKMERLTTLWLFPDYTFVSEIENPHEKKSQEQIGNVDEPFKISVKFPFPCEIPNLKSIVFGNLIEIEDLHFSSLQNLKVFKCGSYWNLSIAFPTERSRKSMMESSVTEIQFPDSLKDPLFVVNVAKHLPHLKIVWMFLPSVPVLRAFFKAFEDSDLEELHLKTQFFFESTMDSCLLSDVTEVLTKNDKTETLLQKLKQYKHFDEYARHYNIELPVQADDLMVGYSAGIRSLRKLKFLHLEHIPRKLKIPIDEERKWNDPDCKFMNTTFGYKHYPLSSRCCKEIGQLKNCSWIKLDNVQPQKYEFAADDIMESTNPCVPVQLRRATSSGAKLKIMPSILFPSVKIEKEGC